MEARDSFSSASDAYARDRPTYPAALFDWISSRCAERGTAWDCATGNGQAAAQLAERFERVEASDVSPHQIGEAFRAANINYSAQSAEQTDFPVASFDLIAVAQALHWFDFTLFWPEVRRVARPGAFFCAWGYSWLEGNEALHERFFEPMLTLLKPYWAPNNQILWDGYRSEDVGFPFERIETPAFAIRLDWDIAAVIRFVRTWSAHKRAMLDMDAARAIARLEETAAERLAERGAMQLVMPLAVAAGRVT